MIAVDQKLALDEIAPGARQVIVFGSRATGDHSPGSDLDLLCVGSGQRAKSARVDLLWIKPEALETDKWLGSELARHIAAYGSWLHGPQDWKKDVFASGAAIENKRRQLTDRIRAWNAHWDDLAPAYRQRLFTLIRRDLQRLEILEEGLPVPPTPRLDRQWKDVEDRLEFLNAVFRRATFLGEPDKSAFASRGVQFLTADFAEKRR